MDPADQVPSRLNADACKQQQPSESFRFERLHPFSAPFRSHRPTSGRETTWLPQELNHRNPGAMLQGRSSDFPARDRRPSRPWLADSGIKGRKGYRINTDAGLQRRDRSRFSRDSLLARNRAPCMHGYFKSEQPLSMAIYHPIGSGSALPGRRWPRAGRPG